MAKRVTITKHDYNLIVWLVRYYKESSVGIRYPAAQNLEELLEKIKPEEGAK